MSIYRSEILVPVQVAGNGGMTTNNSTTHINQSQEKDILKPKPDDPIKFHSEGEDKNQEEIVVQTVDNPTSNNNNNNNHYQKKRITEEKASSYQKMFHDTATKQDEIWFDNVKQRFDDRRRQWHENSQRMRDDFFMKPNPMESAYHHSGMQPNSIYSYSYNNSSSGMDGNPFTTAYERSQKDDIVRFVARFNIPQGIKPNDVGITTKFNQLTVTGRTEIQNGPNVHFSEFNKTIDLPKGIIEDQISATLTADHVLVVECPLEPPSLTNAMNNSIPIRQTDKFSFENASNSTKYQPSMNRPFCPTSTQTNSDHKVLHNPVIDSMGIQRFEEFNIEVPIGYDYLPEEIQVKTLNQRVYINARHEEKLPNKTSFREFSKEYDIPPHVTSENIQAKLEDGVLYITARSS